MRNLPSNEIMKGHPVAKILCLATGVGLFSIPAIGHEFQLQKPAETIKKEKELTNLEKPTPDIASDISFGQQLINAFITPVSASGNATITTKGDYRFIRSNGIPDHATGQFPNSGNPNRISAQKYNFRIKISPVKNASLTQLRPGMTFGVAINGVPIDPGTAGFFNRDPRSSWREEAISASGQGKLGLDNNNAHVQRNGAYHYHGIPEALINSMDKFGLLGYAADGFPIYYTGQKSSFALKKGKRPSGAGSPGGTYDGTYGKDYAYVGGALDQCNGTTGKTPEYANGTYYYVVTSNYPWYPRCFSGTPDKSFKKKGGTGAGHVGPQRPQAGANRRRPPQRNAFVLNGQRPPRPGIGRRAPLRPGLGRRPLRQP